MFLVKSSLFPYPKDTDLYLFGLKLVGKINSDLLSSKYYLNLCYLPKT